MGLDKKGLVKLEKLLTELSYLREEVRKRVNQ